MNINTNMIEKYILKADHAADLTSHKNEIERLERERDSLTDQRDFAQNLIRILERERDELAESILNLSHPNCQILLRERNEAREQRDRLAKSLGQIADLGQMICMAWEPQSFKATEIATDALATLNQQEP